MENIFISLINAKSLIDKKGTQTIQQVADNLRSALKIYLKVLGEIGESAELCSAISDCYFKLSGFPGIDAAEFNIQAIKYVKRAIDLRPLDGRLHAILGSYYRSLTNEYEKAKSEYQKAIELNPCDTKALSSAAFLYGCDVVSPVTLDEAISWAERLVLLEPWEPISHAHLAELYQKAGRFEDARQECLHALLCPGRLDGWLDMIKSIFGSEE